MFKKRIRERVSKTKQTVWTTSDDVTSDDVGGKSVSEKSRTDIDEIMGEG